MSREIRFFLFDQIPGSPVEVEAFRDVASARDKWLHLLQNNSQVSGVLFAGSSRPGVHDIESMMFGWKGFLLISESCRWLLPPNWSTFDRAVEGISAAAQFPEMGFYIGKVGWGYSEDHACNALRRVHVAPIEPTGRRNPPTSTKGQEDFLADLSVLGEDDPFLITRHLPGWALEVPFDQLPLTVRCRNVLQKQRIIRLSDLGKFTREEAMQWQNFGRHSVKDLATTLVSFLKNGPDQLADREDLPNVLELPPLLECMRQSTLVMTEREASIWRARLGLDGPRMTLEQLASLHEVTRERIRQIEAKTLRNYRRTNPWIDAIAPRVDLALQNRESSLFVEDLEQQDSWFSGVAEQPQVLGTLFEYFGPSHLHVWSSHGRPLIATIDQVRWRLLKRNVLETLQQAVDHDFSFNDVDLTVKAALGAEAPSLASLMLAELRPYLRFADGNGDDRRLLSVGRGLTAEIRAILQDAREPIHHLEVVAQCEASLGRTVNKQQVINTLAGFEDTIHFGRGTYGLRRHFPIAEPECARISNLVNEVVLTDPNLRQWHTDEILAEITKLEPKLATILDKYLLNAIVSLSEHIVPMGRMVWIAKKFEGDIPRQRIEIQDACVRLLRDAGRPLHNRELREQVSLTRGISPFFMLSPNGEIARISPGVWGLIDRDFASTSVERQRVLDQLHRTLIERQAPIHMSELENVVYGTHTLPRGMTPYMVMNLAQSDSRMHAYRGRYIGLVGWEALLAEVADEESELVNLTFDFDDPES